MSKILELDEKQSFLTNLGVENKSMYDEAGAENLANLDLAERMKLSSLEYYQELMESRRKIVVRFSGFRERNKTESHLDELFVLFGQTELIYPVERIVSKEIDPPALLEQEYTVIVDKVIPDERRVILGDKIAQSRKKACEIIDSKLANGEKIFLRGNIVGLQGSGGHYAAHRAAFVNIEGLGILGVIRIQAWSAGYVTDSEFRSVVEGNKNAIVNFAVRAKGSIPYGHGKRSVYICDRAEYLSAIGYEPWKIIEKIYPVRTDCIVRIVERGNRKAPFLGRLMESLISICCAIKTITAN